MSTLPSIIRSRSELLSDKNHGMISNTERFQMLRNVSLFKGANSTSNSSDSNSNNNKRNGGETQPIVEKFDKTKVFPPEFYVMKRTSGGGGGNETNMKSDKKVSTSNERKTMYKNNVADRLLVLKTNAISRQEAVSQMQIKREKSMLMDQYLEAKASNYEYRNSGSKPSQSQRGNFLEALVNSQKSSGTTATVSDMPASVMSDDTDQQDSMHNFLLNSANQFKNAESVASSSRKNYQSISEKFVQQQRKYLPSYKKKREAVTFVRPSASANPDNSQKTNSNGGCRNGRVVCSKFKSHVIAKYRAEYFNNNRELLKEYPNFLSQMLESKEDPSATKDQTQLANDSKSNLKSKKKAPLIESSESSDNKFKSS